MDTPRFKEMERAYGFDEVAIVPGDVTVNPDQVITSFAIGNFTFTVPILASAMDAVVDPDMAIRFNKLGGCPTIKSGSLLPCSRGTLSINLFEYGCSA